MVTTSGTMNLKITLNPILSVAAAVVAYASGADAQDYYADYDNETCKNTPPQAWGAKFATIEGCCMLHIRSLLGRRLCGQFKRGNSYSSSK
jgi:hypothetical protein